MPCHRCPNDNENECSHCCPDPIKREKLFQIELSTIRDDVEKKFAIEAQARGYIPVEFLCDVVEILIDNHLMDELAPNIKMIYYTHRQREGKM